MLCGTHSLISVFIIFFPSIQTQRIPFQIILIQVILMIRIIVQKLKQALEEIKNVAMIVNKAMKDGESRAKVLAIQKRVLLPD